jgi:microcompartment protein CcmK/EutM
MRLAQVKGSVVSSVKSTGLSSHKLLLVEDVRPDRTDGEGDDRGSATAYIAVDLAGAGLDEVVIVTLGSAARVDKGGMDVPTDAAVIGIVDSVSIDGRTTYIKE